MNRLIAIVALTISLFILSGCLAAVGGGVRQADLDAWVGVPVKALDTHSLFLTMRLERTLTEDGLSSGTTSIKRQEASA